MTEPLVRKATIGGDNRQAGDNQLGRGRPGFATVAPSVEACPRNRRLS